MPTIKPRIIWHCAALTVLSLWSLAPPANAEPADLTGPTDWYRSHNTGDRAWLELEALMPLAAASPAASDDLLERLRN